MTLKNWRDTGGEFVYKGHRVFTRGSGGGEEALLLLHGFPTACWDFRAMWRPLADRFPRVLTLDFLGFGFSDKPPGYPYSIQDQADIVEALVVVRGVRRIHLLAHDYGACVAQELLARMQERCAPGSGSAALPISCVMLNAALFPEACGSPWIQKLLRSPLGTAYLALAGRKRFARPFAALFGPQTQPGMIELHDYWTLTELQQGRRVLRALFRYVHERREQRPRWARALIESPVPLRFICGAADPVAGLTMAERYRELVPKADVVMLDGVGHYPNVEAADRTLRAFLEFHHRLEEAARAAASVQL